MEFLQAKSDTVNFDYETPFFNWVISSWKGIPHLIVKELHRLLRQDLHNHTDDPYGLADVGFLFHAMYLADKGLWPPKVHKLCLTLYSEMSC